MAIEQPERLTVWKERGDKIGTPGGAVAWPEWLELEAQRLRGGTHWARAWIQERADGQVALYAIPRTTIARASPARLAVA